LSPAVISANLPAFLAIASDVDGEYWVEEHFLREMPEKWTLSFASWKSGRLVGYAIMSRRDAGQAHLHHFMIGRADRGQGLGTAMIGEMENRARRAGCIRLSLKVAEGNLGARRLYERHGYAVDETDGHFLVLERPLEPPHGV
jgi:RimJ/RimL family protein N-acetyltransferase